MIGFRRRKQLKINEVCKLLFFAHLVFCAKYAIFSGTIHTHVLFEGRQTSYNPDIEQYVLVNTHYIEWAIYKLSPETADKAAAAWDAAVDAAQKSITHLEMPARCILNIGGEYMIGSVTLGLNIHNLLGTRYNRSGMNTNLIPQQGRWFMGNIAVRL